MRFKIFHLIILTVLWELPSTANSQSVTQLKENIKRYNSRIQAYYDSSRYHSVYDSSLSKWITRPPKPHFDDSLSEENQRLKQYLLEMLSRIPESLTSHVPSYKEDMSFYGFGTVTSSDKKFRVWTWDTWMGGTRPVISQVFEFETSKGIKVFDAIDTITEGGGSSNCGCDSIYTLQAKKGVTIYLLVQQCKGDSRNWGQGISAFRINDTLERDIPLFQDSIGFINGLYWNNEPTMSPNDAPFVIAVNVHGKTILIPYLNDDGWKHKLYKFDGEHFIYKGIIK